MLTGQPLSPKVEYDAVVEQVSLYMHYIYIDIYLSI